MRQLKTGIPILGSLAILVGLPGCADENQWGSSTNQTGGISLSLSTESSIKTAKPMFRSGDDDSASDPNDLNTYIKVPKSEEFSIKLEKTDESFSKTWTSLQAFIDYAGGHSFSTGSYTLTAFHGEKGKQDFEAPYFEATATFNVLSDEVSRLNLVAELKNSMVTVNYTDGFKEYMSDYHSRLRTQGRADELIYAKEQTAPAFIEPLNAALTVHFTTKEKNFTNAVKIGEFPPMAKTLHNLTLDIAENENGKAMLQVSFDDTLEEENIIIDLTDELFITPHPVITCQGFDNGASIDMLQGSISQSDVKMIVNAAGGIKSAIMTVESNNYRPAWGPHIDLCQATEIQKSDIESAGITAFGFGFSGNPSDSFAILDLSQLSKSVPVGRHTISLQVTDNNNAVSEVASVILDSQPISIDIIGDPQITYGGSTADITVNYNGYNPLSELSFQSLSEQGNWTKLNVLSYEEKTETRTIESRQYIITLELPNNVNSARESLPIRICYNNSVIAEGKINVNVPEYTLEYDAYTDHALMRIITPTNNDPNVISTMVVNFQVRLDGTTQTSNVVREPEKGYIVVQNLKPGKEYSVSSCVTSGSTWNDHSSLIMEAELPVPNGEFNAEGVKLESETLQIGGQYRVSPVDYTLKSSFSYIEPANWATVNSLTAWSGSTNKNTWFIVPSTWLDTSKEEAVLRNVGYNHNGTTPNRSGGAFNIKYYCENAPSENQLLKASGELFLGEYAFNGTETRTEGIAFASRPTAISFDYTYTLNKNEADNGYALITLLAADGTELGSKKFNLEPSANIKTMTIDFNYAAFGKKAAKLIISFKSSNKDVPPIYIPSGSALNEGQGLGNKTVPVNSYHALATGSVLTIDNVKAIYGSKNPVNTPKRTSKKMR